MSLIRDPAEVELRPSRLCRAYRFLKQFIPDLNNLFLLLMIGLKPKNRGLEISSDTDKAGLRRNCCYASFIAFAATSHFDCGAHQGNIKGASTPLVQARG